MRRSVFACWLFVILFSVLFIDKVEGVSDLNVTKIDSNTANTENSNYYRQLYEDQKEYNDRILNTIYWALGGLATAIIAIVGLNVFNSYRSYKAGIEAVKQELLKTNEEFNSQTILNLSQQMEAIKEDLSSHLPKIVKGEILEINEEIDELKLSIQGLRNVFDIHAQENALDLKSEKINFHNLEAEVYKLKKVKATACRSLCKAAMLQIEINRSPNYTLVSLLEILSSLETISSTVLPYVSRLIKVIPEEHESLRVKIEERVKALKVD